MNNSRMKFCKSIPISFVYLKAKENKEFESKEFKKKLP